MSDPATPAGPLLWLLQLTDSSFPSGLYTLSHGLEGLVQQGVLAVGSGPEAVGGVLEGLLRHSAGPADATALALAWRAARGVSTTDPAVAVPALERIDRRLHATRLPAETRVGATRTGRQVLDLAAELLGDPVVDAWLDHVRNRRSPGGLPVAMGLVHARAGVPLRDAVLADLWALCTSVSGAALRLRLVDHRGAQVLLRRAAPVVEQVADDSLRRPLDRLGGFAPALDVAGAAHETAEARLFGS